MGIIAVHIDKLILIWDQYIEICDNKYVDFFRHLLNFIKELRQNYRLLLTKMCFFAEISSLYSFGLLSFAEATKSGVRFFLTSDKELAQIYFYQLLR